MRKLLLSFAALVLLLGTTTLSAHAQAEVTLVAPGGIRAPIEQLIPGFESKTGNKVKATFGSGLGTKKQVAEGVPFDVPVVQPPYPEVIASGNVIAGSAKPLANVSVGVAVKKGAPKPDISSADAVKRMLLDAKAITYPDPGAGTAGARVTEMFQKLGITDQMKAKSTITANSGPAQMAVANGSADLCLAYLSDIHNPGVDAVGALPTDVASADDLVGFLSSHAKDPKASQALLDYLSSPEAAPVYRSEGMAPGR